MKFSNSFFSENILRTVLDIIWSFLNFFLNDFRYFKYFCIYENMYESNYFKNISECF